MKNLKKVLALVLAMVLVIGTVASAKSYPDVKPGNNDAAYEAIDALSTLGLIDGYKDGTFKPEKILNRAEGAKLIAAALSKKDLINERPETGFVDVDGVKGFSWAMGYIDYLEGKNVNGTSIVIGIGDNKFAPERELSYKEFVKMLVVALGYAPRANGNYDEYLGVADGIGLLENVPVNNINEDDKVSRADAAILLYNAVRINTMVPAPWTSFGYVVSDNYLLEDSKNIDYVGLAPNADFNSNSVDLLDPIFTGKNGELSGINAYGANFAVNDYLTTSLIRANVGRNVEGIFFDARYLDQSKNYNEMLYIDFGADKTTKTTYDLKANNVRVSGANQYTATVNGKDVTYNTAAADIAENWFDKKATGSFVNFKGNVTFVEDFYGKVIAVLADTYTDGYVTKVDATRNEIHINEFEQTNNYPTCWYDSANKDIIIDVDNVNNFKKGDYVAATVGSDYTNVEVITNAITGKVEKIVNGNTYVINGNEYKVTVGSGLTLTYGLEGTFYIAKDGTIYKYEAKATDKFKDIVTVDEVVNGVAKVTSLQDGSKANYDINGMNMTVKGIYEIEVTVVNDGSKNITKATPLSWYTSKTLTYYADENVLLGANGDTEARYALASDVKVLMDTVKGDRVLVDRSALLDNRVYPNTYFMYLDDDKLVDVVCITYTGKVDEGTAPTTAGNYAIIKDGVVTRTTQEVPTNVPGVTATKDVLTMDVYYNGKVITLREVVEVGAPATELINGLQVGAFYEVKFDDSKVALENEIVDFTPAKFNAKRIATQEANGSITQIISTQDDVYFLTGATQYYTRVIKDGKFVMEKLTNEPTIKADSDVLINADGYGFVKDIVITETEAK